MTESPEARGERAAADPYAASRANVFSFLAALALLLVASGPGESSWPLRALGPGPWPLAYWWGFSSALVVATSILALAASRSFPRKGPLVAFSALVLWFAAQATGAAIRGVAGGEWLLAVAAALAGAHSIFVLARLRGDGLLAKGDVVLAAIFAFAITAAMQWIGRWAG